MICLEMILLVMDTVRERRRLGMSKRSSLSGSSPSASGGRGGAGSGDVGIGAEPACESPPLAVTGPLVDGVMLAHRGGSF
jgi:hypothetical protein